MDPDAGTLELKSTIPVPGGPAAMAMGPDQKTLYVAQHGALSISALAVNRTTGALTSLQTMKVPNNAVYLSTDRSGRYLLLALHQGYQAAIHAIDGDGRLQTEPVEIRQTSDRPHCIRTDLSNRYLYVPTPSAGKIAQFRFDPATGKAQPLNPPEAASAAGAGPRHLVFHGAMDILYLVNERTRNLTVHAMDPDEGTLAPVQTLPTVPATYSGTNAGADIHLTPATGLFLRPTAGMRAWPVTGSIPPPAT